MTVFFVKSQPEKFHHQQFMKMRIFGPATKGHALILPKKHFRNIFEMDNATASKVFVLAKKIACAMKETLHCDGLNIVQNNEAIAGQTVFHFHMHIIPRYENDGQHILWDAKSSTPDELSAVAELISSAL